MEYFLVKVRKGHMTNVCLVLCFLLTITSLIFYFAIDVFQYSEHRIKKFEPLKLKRLLDIQEDINYFNAVWISDNEIVTNDNSGNIILFDVNKNIKSIIVFNSMKHMKYCQTYQLSADKKYLLIDYYPNKTSSYISTKNYDVINIKTGKQVTLRDTYHKPREIMEAKWSPVGSSLIIVDHYNLYYISTVTQPNHVKQITFHGSKDYYIGVPDWMYSEEILHSKSAMWFSDQGTWLAYATFNETLIPSVYLPQYGIPDTMYDQYSQMFDYRYSKVDDPNPIVQLFVQILNVKNEPVPIPIKPVNEYNHEIILYTVVWSGDEHLYAMWMNRIQNDSHLVHYHITNNTAEIIEVMNFHQQNGWLDFRPTILIDPEHQVALIHHTEQDDDYYGHVCVIQNDGKLRPLTSGKFEVTNLLKWDSESNFIYYLANTENNSGVKHVYRVLADFKQQEVKPQCLTCDTECIYSNAVFSEKNTYYAHICTGLNTIPYVNIVKTEENTSSAWEKNKKVNKELEHVGLPKTRFLNVPLVDGFEARVKLLIPPTIDLNSSREKCPLLIFTYGGPLINVALDEFDVNMNTYLSANHNIVVAQVDGRGTSGRGSNILYANYKNLGTGEIDDQIIVAKYLQNYLPYVDSDKTGIWGWSNGGYIAGMVLAKDNENIFKYALSIAPITDWIYYDSMYTERFMDSYKDNFQSYRNASLIGNAEGLRGKNYMIIHGLSDDNVHFQHSAMLSKELQHKAILFKQQFYPDESHKLLNVRHHLYRTIISYILNCLK